MASDINVKKLISSTASYAKKSAAAADKNANGRLTKTEAKALPKDLADDFKRQTKGKSSVTTAAFVHDQTAYVAIAARAADANHDGVLSAAEQGNMPASLADNLESYARTHAPKPFEGVSIKAAAVPAALSGAQGAMPTGTTFSAAFKAKGSDLTAMLADPEAHKAFFNDLLFKATGTDYQKNYPDYYGPTGLEVLQPITQAAAVKNLVDDLIEPGMSRADLTAKAKAMVAATAGTGTKLYTLLWTNHDDASFNAVIAFDTRTGSIRASGYMNEP